MQLIQALANYQVPHMGLIDALFHLFGFSAPAVAVAMLVALAGRVFLPVSPQRLSWWAQAAINSIAGVFVLAAGLWYFGVDGKMATYTALVLAIATCQWFSSRAWRGMEQ
ncbi:MAG: hypothetical protein ABIR26_03955 [Ramlibacter sp.]